MRLFSPLARLANVRSALGFVLGAATLIAAVGVSANLWHRIAYAALTYQDIASAGPIEHIHVKVRPEGGAEVTSQLYFPNRPIDGLTVTLEDRGDHFVGYFNFVVQR